MVYDWDGARTRRLKLYKTSVVLFVGTAFVTLAVAVVAFHLPGL